MVQRAGVTFRWRRKLEPYLRALEMVGVDPVPISPDARRSLEGLDGLLLTGGTDVNPAYYGESPHPETEDCDDERDRMESELLEEALERDLPVMAICRGMQLFNVVHGGTLVQHVANHRVKSGDSSASVHEVEVAPGTRLAAILGQGRHHVNSRHHQAIARLGDGLTVSATSVGDNLVEALERADRRFAVAVQWHPEDQTSEPSHRKLFEAFAAALRRGTS